MTRVWRPETSSDESRSNVEFEQLQLVFDRMNIGGFPLWLQDRRLQLPCIGRAISQATAPDSSDFLGTGDVEMDIREAAKAYLRDQPVGGSHSNGSASTGPRTS